MMKRTRVLSAVGSDDIRNLLARFLDGDGIVFIGEDAVYLDGVIPLTNRYEGDVLLLSTALKDGISLRQIVKTLQTEKPDLKFVVLDLGNEDKQLTNWLQCSGVKHILNGGALEPEKLRQAILSVREKEPESAPAAKEKEIVVEKPQIKIVERQVEIIRERFVTSVVISVFNITRGGGSTTTTLQLASIIRKSGYSVCAGEANNSGDFWRIGGKHNGIELFTSADDLPDIITSKKYNYVILDYGALIEFTADGERILQKDPVLLNEFKRSAVKIAVSNLNKWSLDKINHFAQSGEWPDLRYLFTNGSKTNTMPKIPNAVAINREDWEYALLDGVMSKPKIKRC